MLAEIITSAYTNENLTRVAGFADPYDRFPGLPTLEARGITRGQVGQPAQCCTAPVLPQPRRRCRRRHVRAFVRAVDNVKEDMRVAVPVLDTVGAFDSAGEVSKIKRRA